MEAVPRLPMLAFELKHSPEYVDFGPTLKKYIREHYGEDPALYNKNFADLDQLRQNAIHVTRDFLGCRTLKRYYAQLLLLKGRFPMNDGGEAAVTFTWEDNQTGRDHVIADIKFEQACILYNIGALHSNLGAVDTRQNAEGMKVSCTHFQIAAWAFEHLRDHFGSSSMSTDMAHEFLTFHVNVMLAQAQECILEKSMIDSRKNTITAKVAAQVVEFYRLAVKNLTQCNNEQVINARSYKDWKKRIELKIAFFQCITFYYMGRQSEEQQKWGERLAYFQAAQDKLNEAVKFGKNEVPEMQEALSFAQDVVGGKLQASQKDNDFVYHDKIPPLDSLPEVKGAPLVKGIPFDPNDPEIAGPDIFQKLVPMETHEASSIYSEEKAKLLRAVMEDVETANTELEQFMASLQIDATMFEELPDRLPQELLEKCAAMSVRTNAIKDLTESMSTVSGLATEVELNIKEIQDMISEDAQKTEEFERQFGKKMVSNVLSNMSKECEDHLEKHKQGSQLNTNLHVAMNAHIANLKLLVLPPEQIQAKIPPAHPPKNPEYEEVMTEMRRLLSKVDEMKNQRATLEQQFRENIQKDDITSVLMAVDATKESIYKDQLKKHDSLIKLIGQNLSAQMNVLRALTDANAKFAVLRQSFGQQSTQRTMVIQDLINSFETYEELLAKSKKGQDYYRRLNEAVMKTLNRCGSECKVRQEERDLIMSKYAPKIPPPSRPTAPKPGTPITPGTPTPTMTITTPSATDLQLPPGIVPSALPAFEGPKLKDFLPFMKPQSFGPKRSSSSPQSLPPGSPDPVLSGPPSFASSASDSPQHQALTQMLPHGSQDYLPRDGSHHVVGQYPGMPVSVPDLTSADKMPTSRPSREGLHGIHAAPPPDVTANLPVNPEGQPHHMSVPDVSSLSFSSLPPNLPAHSQVGAATVPARGQAGMDMTLRSTSRTDSLTSAGSYQHGYLPLRQFGTQGHNLALDSVSSGYVQNMTAGLPMNVIHYPPVSLYQQPAHPNPISHHQPQQSGVSGQYSAVQGFQRHQNMVRPSPTSSPVSSATTFQTPQHDMQGLNGSSILPHQSLTAAIRPETPPQQTLPHQFQPQNNQTFQQQTNQPQQYYIGGTKPHDYPDKQNQQQQPAMAPQVSHQSYISSQTGQPVLHSMPPIAHQGHMPDMRSVGVAQSQVQSYPQMPVNAAATSNYNPPSTGAQGQYSAVAASVGQSSASAGQGFSSSQNVPGQYYTTVAGAASGQLQTSNYSQQPMLHQQISGMLPQSQDIKTQNQQFPQPHSQLQPNSQQSQFSSQQPFPHHQPVAQQNIQNQQQQEQYSFNAPGQVVMGQPQIGPQNVQSVKANVGQTSGVFTSGATSPAVRSPTTSQTSIPTISSQQTFPQQQQFQPHLQQHQQRLPTSGSHFSGYSQMVPGSGTQYSYGLASQPQVSQLQTGQGQAVGSQRIFSAQQAYPNSQQPQQLPQQHQFVAQQQFPRQQFPQQYPPQQHFAQPQQQMQNMPSTQGQQHPHASTPSQLSHPQQQFPQSHPQIPPESQLIFPTPLQPSRVQPAETVHPQPPASQQGGDIGVAAEEQHSLPPQGAKLHQFPPTQAVQQAHPSQPAIPVSSPASSQVGLAPGSGTLRQESSLDELLSSSPEGSKHTAIPAPIITPKVLTDQEKQQQKEEAMKKGAIVETVKDPYQNSCVLNKFVSDVEAFGKFVDDLSITILGVSRLDTVWKSLIDSQDHDIKKQSIAIARCYPMKNREPDIMPYDETRVVLTTTKDDYINASWVNDLAPSCPKFVATQAPLSVTMTDFWAMVYELGSEVIVQITSEYETSKKFPVYFPTEKGQQMEQGPIILNLQSVKYRQLWIERNVYLKHSQTKQGRTVIHLQFKTWPVSGFPDEVQHIVRFISEVHSFYQQQRSLLKPVIVHCGNGVGRTGAFLMIYTGMQEILHGNGLIDVPALARRMLQKRKSLIHKKEQLKFCYDALLCFAEEFLKKRNILVQHPHFEKKIKISEPAPIISDSEDIVLGSVNLHTLQQTVGRLRVHGDSDKGSPNLADQSGQTYLLPGKDAEPVSSLPDLIQQQSHSDAGIGQGLSGTSLPSVQGTGGAVDGRNDFTKSHSRSGSNTSLQSYTSLTESGSSRASPQHGPSVSHSPSPSSVGAGSISQSLADLQDPSKFTIGKGEHRKRISKASFDKKGSGTSLEAKPDPADPLSSLDPLWTIHKPANSEK